MSAAGRRFAAEQQAAQRRMAVRADDQDVEQAALLVQRADRGDIPEMRAADVDADFFDDFPVVEVGGGEEHLAEHGIEATGPVILERIGCLHDVENGSWFAKIPRQDNGLEFLTSQPSA
jgi:hypothetical protein